MRVQSQFNAQSKIVRQLVEGLFGLCSLAACGSPDLQGMAPPLAPVFVADSHLVAEPGSPRPFTAMTFNVGTTPGLPHDQGEADGTGNGYTQEMADIADAEYENSLSWIPAEQALTEYLREQQLDLVAFQELYYDPWCESIEVDPTLDFVCQDYSPDRPLQVQRLLGSGYQIACAPGQEDNCIGVSQGWGRLKNCGSGPEEVCFEAFQGSEIWGCSSGLRVGAAQVELSVGLELTVVLIHGTSGFKPADIECRRQQFQQIFVDQGNGTPLATGKVTVILGDINTDPFLADKFDKSAQYWHQFVGFNQAFRYLSSDHPGGPKTYLDLFRIDHVVSDRLFGDCVVPGASPGVDPVMAGIYWDHKPVTCQVGLPGR